jgi:hypothetical protein
MGNDMNIDFLLGSLEITENPGMDTTDPKFDEIATLVMNGNELEAANLVEPILLAGVYDIRLICYYLYGHWQEHDLLSLGEVLECLIKLMGENFDAIGPANKREKNFVKSLDWLFRQLLKKMQYEEGKRTELWQHWQKTVTADDLELILELDEPLCQSINNRLGDSLEGLIEAWSKIADWLKSLQRLVYVAPEPQDIEAETDGRETASEGAPVSAFRFTGMEIESSYHMELLLQKLSAFEQLIKQENYSRAALVADDINLAIATFDPKLYFPKVYKTFVKLQAVNYEQLSVYAEEKENPQWNAMQEWFQVDIDSFVNT